MRIVKMGALVSLLLLLFSGLAMASSWSGSIADQRISNYFSGDNNAVQKIRIAAGPEGNLYAIWRGGSYSVGYELYFSKSTDGGATWSGTSGDMRISADDGQNVSTTGGDKVFGVAVNSVGDIFVVWAEDLVDVQEIMMIKSTDQGSTWVHSDADFPISYDGTPAVDARDPEIAIDGNDNLYVVWYQDTAIDTAEIHISISTDDGATWSGTVEDKVISYGDGHDASQPAIAIAPNNDIYVVWGECDSLNVSATKQICYGKSTDGGSTFNSMTADYPISAELFASNYSDIVIDNSGNIHVVWRASQSTSSPYYYRVFYSRSTDGGANWSSFTGIDDDVTDGESSYGVGLAATSTGKLCAVWHEDPYSESIHDIWASYSTDGGGSWSGPFSIDPVSNIDLVNGRNAYNPDVVADAGDTLHVAFYQYPPSPASYYEAYYSRSDTLAGQVGPTPGRLEGTVTDFDTSNPLSDATVTVDTNGVVIDSDITDINGEYSITLAPLTYYSATFHIYTHIDSTIDDITILEGEINTLDVALHRETLGTISGHIYEVTGTNPLTNAAISAYDGPSMGDDSTDGTGYYEIELYPGTYTMEFTADLFEDTTITGVVLEAGGSVVVDVNMTWAIPADDIGPIAIIEPPDIMLTGTSYTPKIEIENYGYQDQTFNLNLVITDESLVEVYNDTYTGATVDSLSTELVTMGADFTPTSEESYTFTVTTNNTGDEEPANDVYTADISAYTHQGYGGPDGYGYSYRDNTVPCGPTFNWIDISETGTQIEPGSHYFMSDELPIGFSFEFYGQTYSVMHVCSHGYLCPGSYTPWDMTNTCPLPSPNSPYAPMICPWWDGKTVQYEIGQGVYYQYFDDPTNDYTIIQWDASTYDINQPDDTTQCEVIIYENGRILFQYNKVSPTIAGGQGDSAAVGLEFDVAPDLYGISYLCDDDNPANRLHAGLAIEWLVDADLPGSITGTVTDESTQNPIENVLVTALGIGISDYTNASGEYTLPGLYACDYDVSFSHPDYTDQVVGGVTVTPDNATVLDVEMGAGVEYLPGDANMRVGQWPPQVIGGDVTYLVGYFRGINQPCLLDGFYCSADANGDCLVIGSDVTKMVTYFRGLTQLEFCPDYPPAWLSPDDLPPSAPSGWPNCEEPTLSGKSNNQSTNDR